ncbi:hypothetical protein PHO31112_02629 [Pandoraea horticolens]|uniref:Uncharacterized protein n=2 Tax=Pandoraea horticolens TaxID=2508298 RepID=A0A5E4VHT3_9BURK|nr:hypothetical protein PHO31112_02629 [Pandoraea horticolens]
MQITKYQYYGFEPSRNRIDNLRSLEDYNLTAPEGRESFRRRFSHMGCWDKIKDWFRGGAKKQVLHDLCTAVIAAKLLEMGEYRPSHSGEPDEPSFLVPPDEAAACARLLKNLTEDARWEALDRPVLLGDECVLALKLGFGDGEFLRLPIVAECFKGGEGGLTGNEIRRVFEARIGDQSLIEKATQTVLQAGINQELERDNGPTGNTIGNTHREQYWLDFGRTGDVQFVLADGSRVQAKDHLPQSKDLDAAIMKGDGATNVAALLIDQRYSTLLSAKVVQWQASLREDDDFCKKFLTDDEVDHVSSSARITWQIPTEFHQTRTVRSTFEIKNHTQEYNVTIKADLRFSQDFYQQIVDGSAMGLRRLGAEHVTITRLVMAEAE